MCVTRYVIGWLVSFTGARRAQKMTQQGKLAAEHFFGQVFDFERDPGIGGARQDPVQQIEVFELDRLVQINPLCALPAGAGQVNFAHFAQRQCL